jgi:predicted negative regulator of RcsB-dependent stress response
MKIFFVLLLIIQIPNVFAQNAAYFFEQGMEWSRKASYEEAILSFDNAIALAPQVAEGYAMRGIAKSKLYLYKSALEDMEKALSLKPRDAWWLHQKALLLFKLGQFEATVEEFSDLVRIPSKNEWDFFWLAEAKYVLKKRNLGTQKQYSFYEIVGNYSQAIALKPDFANAYFQRALARLDSLESNIYWIPTSKDYEGICADMEKARLLGNTQADALAKQVCKNIPERITEKIFRLIEFKKTHQDKNLLSNLFSQLLNVGAVDSPFYYKALLLKADFHLENKDLKTAMRDYDACLSLRNLSESQLQTLFFKKAMLFVSLNDLKNALNNLDRAIELGYEPSWAFLERGNIQKLLGNEEDACADWLKAEAKGNQEAKNKLKQFCKVIKKR